MRPGRCDCEEANKEEQNNSREPCADRFSPWRASKNPAALLQNVDRTHSLAVASKVTGLEQDAEKPSPTMIGWYPEDLQYAVKICRARGAAGVLKMRTNTAFPRDRFMRKSRSCWQINRMLALPPHEPQCDRLCGSSVGGTWRRGWRAGCAVR